MADTFRRSFAVVGTWAALSLACSVPVVAADPHADPFCPEAVSKTNAFVDVAKGKGAADIAAAAHAVYETYAKCAANASLEHSIEPAEHYNLTRAAQYAFAEGRALIAAGKTDDGVKALQISRKLSDGVVTWLPVPYAEHASNVRGQSWTESNPDRRPSVYAPNAQAVRDAADAELQKLGYGPPPAAKKN